MMYRPRKGLFLTTIAIDFHNPLIKAPVDSQVREALAVGKGVEKIETLPIPSRLADFVKA